MDFPEVQEHDFGGHRGWAASDRLAHAPVSSPSVCGVRPSHALGTRETFGLAIGCHQDRGRALSNKVTARRDGHFPPAESDSSEASELALRSDGPMTTLGRNDSRGKGLGRKSPMLALNRDGSDPRVPPR